MTKKRKKYSSQFKFKVALEAVKGVETINTIASKHSVHPNQVSAWKKRLLEEGETVFGQDAVRQLRDQVDNLTPAVVYAGKEEEVLSRREQIKQETLEKRRRNNTKDFGLMYYNARWYDPYNAV